MGSSTESFFIFAPLLFELNGDSVINPNKTSQCRATNMQPSTIRNDLTPPTPRRGNSQRFQVGWKGCQDISHRFLRHPVHVQDCFLCFFLIWLSYIHVHIWCILPYPSIPCKVLFEEGPALPGRYAVYAFLTESNNAVVGSSAAFECVGTFDADGARRARCACD